jgi:hypothetical protein
MVVPKFVRVVSFILILLRVRMEAWLDVQSSVKKGWLLSRLRRKCMVARQNFPRCRCACALTALPSGLVYDPNMIQQRAYTLVSHNSIACKKRNLGTRMRAICKDIEY